MTAIIQVLTTCGTQAEAEQLAASLVADRLAACAQLEAITSYYHWDGAVQHDPEIRISFKTRQNLYAPLAARIRALSSYQTPQIIALPVLACDDAYRQWIEDSTLQGPPATTGV